MPLEFFKNWCQKSRCQWNPSRILHLINKARNYIFASIWWSWYCHLLIRMPSEFFKNCCQKSRWQWNSSRILRLINKARNYVHSCVNLMILKLLNGDAPSIPYVLVASPWHYGQNCQMLSKNAIPLFVLKDCYFNHWVCNNFEISFSLCVQIG